MHLKIIDSKKLNLTIIILIIIVVVFYLYRNALPSILWQRTRYENMNRISIGIKLYNGKYDRLPKSLNEVVTAGFLPEKSKIYYCPIKHNHFFSKELLYSECEYVVTFDPNVVVISVSEEVWDNKSCKSINQGYKKIEVWAGTKAYKTGKEYLEHRQNEYKQMNDNNYRQEANQ
jgi:hypothetical protein